ncbi:hypothetical protein [Synechococcus sp. RS9907]|uniref:hypothetical protein n=1 Tax=Synechococcus sp. RS9907 TaxID=221350 RepID=UPI00165DC9E6|nr:hypothetical protein [Synechococcus sp. RS9907]
MCRGWITDWEELEDGITRIYINNPLIKIPNKDVRFDNLEVLSKEDHINLFIKDEHIGRHTLAMYKPVEFAGSVYHYTRSNGTHDYGIQTEPFSFFDKKLNRFIETSNRITSEFSISIESLTWTEKIAPIILENMLEDLEASGDLLPTFDGTYSDFKGLIEKTKTTTAENARQIRCIASSRKLRREYGVKSNFCLEPIDLDSIRPRLEAFF